MALPDPELDLLRELLEEDPTDPAFMTVGQELVRREMWEEAEQVLSAGLQANANEKDGWSLLARAALELGNGEQALAAVNRLEVDPKSHPKHAKIFILANEIVGNTELASQKALEYLDHHPNDMPILEAVERLDSPDPEPAQRAADPFVSVARAEQYAALGRIDRAVRAYRQILFHNPGDRALQARLVELQAQPHEPVDDDLSEELTDPGVAPPDLQMPQPRLQAGADDEVTQPTLEPEIKVYESGGPEEHSVAAFDEDDIPEEDAETDPGAPRRVAGPGNPGEPRQDAKQADEEPTGKGKKLAGVKAKGKLGEIAKKRRKRRSLLRR